MEDHDTPVTGDCDDCKAYYESIGQTFEECQQRGIKLSELREKCDNLELQLDDQIATIRNAALDEANEAMLTSDEIRGDCMRDAIRVIKSLRTNQEPHP